MPGMVKLRVPSVATVNRLIVGGLLVLMSALRANGIDDSHD